MILAMFAVERTMPAASSSRTVAAAAEHINAQLKVLENLSRTGDTSAVIARAQAITSEMSVMLEKSIMVVGENRKRWAIASNEVESALDELSDSASSPEKNSAALARLQAAWGTMKSLYPTEALEVLPPLWSCPMHPELLEHRADSCPTCGMPLEPLIVTQPDILQKSLIHCAIESGTVLSIGAEAKVRFRLMFDDNSPVHLSDLETVHTQPIHLLIIDPTLNDYHHVHPREIGEGEYAFRFTPLRPGPYRLWADVKPMATHVQQYAIADMASEKQGAQAGDEPENREVEIGGYKFALSFEKSAIHPLETLRGNLRVTGPDGTPFTGLEVVMGAFGHFVGFRDDFSTVLHIHPSGAQPETPDAHGGPDLPFYFRFNNPGLIRLFTQVQIGGENYFPRFVVRVLPTVRSFP